MEMHLQPLATTCSVSGEPFVEGMRVASFLVRSGAALEIARYDVIEEHAKAFSPEGVLACRWVQPFKPRKQGENSERALKLTAENLFVALADPTTEPTPENTRLVQFLALMLERKKLLRPRGRSTDGVRNRFEHARSKQIFEIPAGDLTPEFFVAVQQQLSVLVGGPKTKAGAVTAPSELPVTDADASSSASVGASKAAETAAAVSAVGAATATSDAVAGETSADDSSEPAAGVEPAAPSSEVNSEALTMETEKEPIAPPAGPISSEAAAGAALPADAEGDVEALATKDPAIDVEANLEGEAQADAVFEGDADAGAESQSEAEVEDASDEERPAPGSTGGGSGGTAAA